MSNSTSEFWYCNGVSLNQYAWAIKTFGGTPRGLPLLRGGNIKVAYNPGQIFRPKWADSRVISLLMWTAGIDPATDQPSADPRLQFSDNFMMLRRLFYTPGSQVSLTRQWYYTQPVGAGVPTLVAATAQAQIAGTMDPSMTGQGRADFSVDLLLADPYFYGPSKSLAIPYGTVTHLFNPGDAEIAYVGTQATVAGPATNPRLTNSTNSVWFQLNTVIASGDSVAVDVSSMTAVRQSDGFILTGAITHSGHKRWMSYASGDNQLMLTSTSGAGSATVSYQPPYV